MPSITLHPTLGVNPHLTFCRRCGGESDEIVLIGARDSIYCCDECGLNLIGGGPCPKHPHRSTTFVRKVGERERLPGGPCKACRDEIDLHAKVVAEGGVYFRCDECGARGVIRPEAEISKLVRQQIPSGPAGFAFEKCAQHQPA